MWGRRSFIWEPSSPEATRRSSGRLLHGGGARVADFDHTSKSYIDHLHQRTRDKLKGLPKDFVLHSLRHTMLTWLGEAGVALCDWVQELAHPSREVANLLAGY